MTRFDRGSMAARQSFVRAGRQPYQARRAGLRKMPPFLAQVPHRVARFARRVCASGGAMPK
jgi:hypothetical protein